jgi:hypothetical protein
MNLKQHILVAIITLTLAAFPPAARANLGGLLKKAFGPAPVQLDASPTPEKSVSVDSFKQLKDCKKVVVTAFNVQFLTSKKASSSAGRETEGAAHINSNIKLLASTTRPFRPSPTRLTRTSSRASPRSASRFSRIRITWRCRNTRI